LLGAAAGAAINGGHGASVGAGTGLALGGLSGAGAADQSASQLQQRYDIGYEQCMYAKGHRIPVARGDLMDDFFRGHRDRYIAPPVAWEPVSPPVYIEQNQESAPDVQEQQDSWWYYCPAQRAYYPYVKTCPQGWQRVAPQPPDLR
jgi:hypothetical protein